MNDIDRQPSDEILDLERSLLEEARREQPTTEALARTLDAIGVAGTAAVTAGAVAGTATTAKSWGTLAIIVGVFGVGAVVGITAIGLFREPRANDAAVVSRMGTPTAGASTMAPSLGSAESTAPIATEGDSPPTPASTSVTGAAPSPIALPVAVPTTKSSVESTAPLGPEIALIDRARSALKGQQPLLALKLLDQYGSEFPNGRLAPEAAYLRIEALIESGQRDAAAALAKKTLGNSQSPRAKHIRALLEAGEKSP